MQGRRATRRFAWMLAALLALAAPALAIDLNAARTQGLVGEQADGFVAAVPGKPASAEVTKLVNEVNARRKAVGWTVATAWSGPS